RTKTMNLGAAVHDLGCCPICFQTYFGKLLRVVELHGKGCGMVYSEFVIKLFQVATLPDSWGGCKRGDVLTKERGTSKQLLLVITSINYFEKGVNHAYILL
ncbi:MAG: hypothetical protein D3909_16725, partial [Candidatus Electrothrix sp. ATG1]|nr:hypothetical protein [Candidatus Electrothrix sp. ATG1]